VFGGVKAKVLLNKEADRTIWHSHLDIWEVSGLSE